MSHRIRICCGVTAILLLIIVGVFTTLAFTVFKPKNPVITAQPIGLEKFQATFQGKNLTQNVTVGMVITVDNRNYGSFTFHNSTAYVTYYGEVIGEVPIQEDKVPAHAKIKITTFAVIMADRLLANPNLIADLAAGQLTVTSTAMLNGKVNMLKIMKLHATVFSQCDISVILASRRVESNCNSKIKL